MPVFEYDKDYPFAAFITNLGKYNEGELVGEWVRFPTTAEEIKKVFERIGIGQRDDFGNPYEEWFISDYDCYVGGLYDKLGEYESLDELNYLAAKLDDMDRYEYGQFLAAMDIAFDMDEFFRHHDPQYAADHPEAHEAKEEIYEKLMAGRISALEEKLSALGQTENDYLLSEIEKLKDATGYEEWLDFDPAEVKAGLENPDKSHVDDMLSFAEKAEREYAAEAAAYVQTPADIAEQAQAVYGEPDAYETGERIQTPRGSFAVTNLSREQMEAAGYGYHHSSEDKKYLIMGNGTRAFAIPAEQPEKDNPLRTAEMTIEDDYGMIDGVINNGRRGEGLEKAKETAEKKPSIRERLEDAKRECSERPKPEKQRSGRNTPEHGDL